MEEKHPKNFLSWETLLFALVISTFGVLFLWSFWTSGALTLGINFTLFWIFIILFFLFASKTKISSKSLFWLIPVFLIALSFSLWTNTFVRLINIALLPLTFFIFSIHETQKEDRDFLWSRFFPLKLLLSGLLAVRACFLAPFRIALLKNKHLEISSKGKMPILKEVITGILILVILSTFIIIPLLSSADENFANIFKSLLDYIRDILVIESMMKIFVAALGTIFLLGVALFWKDSPQIEKAGGEQELSTKNTPDITIGIILSGILILYIMFIAMKINGMFVGELPSDFSLTERFVKTGFWQLFALTLLNILFYIGIYKKTHSTVQGILLAFTTASLLLIFSAAQGVFKYVYTYGLSYEKFFAFYTVIFCSFVFLWFISLFLFHKERKINILKSLAFSALWMYSLATVLPLESIIFKTNLTLSAKENSRVNVNELRMLGFDALPTVEKNFNKLLVLAEEDHQMKIQKNVNSHYGLQEAKNEYIKESWVKWIENNRAKVNNFHSYARSNNQKKWCEKTVRELFYSPILSEKDLALPPIKTWTDSESGYKISYSTNLKTRYSSYSKELSIMDDDGQTRLIIKTYPKNGDEIDKDEQDKKEKVLEIMESLKKNNDPNFILSEKSNLKAYVASYFKEDKSNLRYSLLLETPTKIFQFDSVVYIKKLENIQSMTLDEFLAHTFQNDKVSEVIKSFELVENEK